MGLRCKLGLHKWKYNDKNHKEGTMRTCMRCDREEMYYFGKWNLCLQGEMVHIAYEAKLSEGDI